MHRLFPIMIACAAFFWFRPSDTFANERMDFANKKGRVSWDLLNITNELGVFTFATRDGDDHKSASHFYQISQPFPAPLTVSSLDFGFDDWGFIVSPDYTMFVVGPFDDEKEVYKTYEGYLKTRKNVKKINIDDDRICGRSLNMWEIEAPSYDSSDGGVYNNDMNFSLGTITLRHPIHTIVQVYKGVTFPAGSVLFMTSHRATGLDATYKTFDRFMQSVAPIEGSLTAPTTQRVKGRIKVKYQLWTSASALPPATSP